MLLYFISLICFVIYNSPYHVQGIVTIIHVHDNDNNIYFGENDLMKESVSNGQTQAEEKQQTILKNISPQELKENLRIEKNYELYNEEKIKKFQQLQDDNIFKDISIQISLEFKNILYELYSVWCELPNDKRHELFIQWTEYLKRKQYVYDILICVQIILKECIKLLFKIIQRIVHESFEWLISYLLSLREKYLFQMLCYLFIIIVSFCVAGFIIFSAILKFVIVLVTKLQFYYNQYEASLSARVEAVVLSPASASGGASESVWAQEQDEWTAVSPAGASPKRRLTYHGRGQQKKKLKKIKAMM